MTSNRASIFTLAILAFAIFATFLSAAPPAALSGKYLSLAGERLEFPDGVSGSGSGGSFQYTYTVGSEVSASLQIGYPDTGRQRAVTLNFSVDGTPLDYQEFDFASMNPPMPPMVRTGLFEIGDLESAPPPPPTESSAPDSLTSLFVMAGGKRYEFLTAENGRRYDPGASAYFTYVYAILDDRTSQASLLFEGASEAVNLVLEFDETGAPVVFTMAEEAGSFSLGTNLHRADLKIGTDEARLVGGDWFGAVGRQQTASLRTGSTDPIVFPFEIENDGEADAFRLRASRSRGNFRVAYGSHPDGANVTAAIVAGTLVTTELAHREGASYRMKVTPLRAKGAFLGRVEARSLAVAGAGDTIHAFALVKSRPKPPSRGKGKAGQAGKRALSGPQAGKPAGKGKS